MKRTTAKLNLRKNDRLVIIIEVHGSSLALSFGLSWHTSQSFRLQILAQTMVRPSDIRTADSTYFKHVIFLNLGFVFDLLFGLKGRGNENVIAVDALATHGTTLKVAEIRFSIHSAFCGSPHTVLLPSAASPASKSCWCFLVMSVMQPRQYEWRQAVGSIELSDHYNNHQPAPLTGDSLVVQEWLEADRTLEVAFFAVFRLRFILTFALGQPRERPGINRMHIRATRMAHFCLILSTKASPPSLRAWDRKSHECHTSTWIAARDLP
jgi:hypothetical protein